MNQSEVIEYKGLLAGAVEIGKYLLAAGAEVSRVENTVERIMYAYGVVEVDVFALQSFILASVRLADGTEFTRTRRILSSGTDLRRMEELNAFSRQICAERPSAVQLRDQLLEIVADKSNAALTALGYVLSVFPLTVFFGGSLADGLAASVIALLFFGIDRFLRNTQYNLFVYTLFASFVEGSLAILFVRLGLGEHADKIMIGDIMLLIPGLSLCNAVKDILHKDNLTGLGRMVEAIMVTLFIAFGFYIASVALGGGLINSDLPEPSPAMQVFTSALGCVGFALYFMAKPDKLPLAFLGGGLAWALYLLAYRYYPSVFAANAVAAAGVCLYSECMSRIVKAPANVFMITSVIPLLPGSYLYYAIAGLMSQDMAQFYDYGARALHTTLGIEGGFLVAYFVFTRLWSVWLLLKKKRA